MNMWFLIMLGVLIFESASAETGDVTIDGCTEEDGGLMCVDEASMIVAVRLCDGGYSVNYFKDGSRFVYCGGITSTFGIDATVWDIVTDYGNADKED